MSIQTPGESTVSFSFCAQWARPLRAPPGDGPHRYIFTVHALKVDHLDLPATGTAAFVGFNLHANTLATASFTARYGR